MSSSDNDKSIESSEDNIFTSQNTQTKIKKCMTLKEENKDIRNISNHSGDEELIKKKVFVSSKDLNFQPKQQLSTNEINSSNKRVPLALSLSPIKKGRKKNVLVDIMEKSKKIIAPRRSVIFIPNDLKLTNDEKDDKNVRKDGYGVPINKKNRKKIKVTFIDTLNPTNNNEKNQLAEIIPIASYKKYNYIEGLPREEDMETNKSTCQCCLIN